ncbi:MAG: PH domain-containing protein [Patescibacteria group bacterium]
MIGNGPHQFKKDFPNQKSNEKTILILRKHWFILAWPFFKGVLFIIAAIFLLSVGKVGFYVFNSAWLTFLYLAWVVFWASSLLYEYLNWYRDRFVITNQRVVNVDQKSVFQRRVSEVELDKIQDIAHEINGVVATALDFGNIIISSAGSDNIELRDIAQPAEIQDVISKLVKEATAEPPVTVDELVDFIKQQRL